MKKFNTKTLLIGILIVIGIFVIIFTAFSQRAYGQKVLDPPTDLFATVEDENDVNLFWTAPSTGGSTYLSWDSGENYDSFGNFLGPFTMTFVSKYDPVHITAYEGWEIKTMRFWITNPLATVKLKIMTGPDATEVYSQNVASFNLNAWTEIDLTTPFTIDASTELWVGVWVNMPVPGAAMGIDAGPAINGYGNLYLFNSVWNSDFNYNWNLQAFIESPADNLRESLLGYNIYRDGEKINENTHGSTSFVDMNLLNGIYDYHVTAVYDDGESGPSNEIEVQINQPVITYQDSMALVDIYNNCNGPNWIINDNWLVGPVNEWYGVFTTGTRVTQLWLQSKGLTGDIPESIGNLTALEKLHLSSNNITSIPSTIENLVELNELWLGFSPIQSIPETIGNLINLKQLHLGLLDNPLGTLPDSFCNLESLEWCALGGAGLDSLPENFGNLTSLETLFIWGNNLTELPESFGNLESLDHLNMDWNPITHLPENFGNLSNLESFRFESNLLTNLPESFSNLENLEFIWGIYNQLEALPEDFGNLDSLKFMRLDGNFITSLPASFTDMASIETIYLSYNLLESVPEDIDNLTTLDFFEVSGNQLTELPATLVNLPTLSVLGAMNNFLTELPDNFSDLEADSLAIAGNYIAEFPAGMLDNEYDLLWIANNKLQFGSIEPFVGVVPTYDFWYAPQRLFGNDTVVELIDGQDFEYTLEVSGENNVYQWFKDSVAISGQNTNTLTLENVGSDDEGFYFLAVSNTVATELILTSHLIELQIGDCNPWTYAVTGSIHSINIPASSNPNIDGQPLYPGDWIGVFYLDDSNQEMCGGALQWFPFGKGVLSAYGDDPTTPEKDGFADGEAFIWKMFQCSEATEHAAMATYNPDMPDQGFFADLGASTVTSLTNIGCQDFELMSGWNDISIYLIPDAPSVEAILSPVAGQMILMRNLTQVYWPGSGVNTIGDWDPASGYAIKLTENASLSICGNALVSKELTIQEGWSYLPVPSECSVDVNEVFGPVQNDIIIIQDLIGTEIYWPSQGIYTLNALQPGKAYKIKTNQAISLTFPECSKRENRVYTRSNQLSTKMGKLAMTPFTESVAINKNAIENFEQGDIIAALNQSGEICGMMTITGFGSNNGMILFGDDPATQETEGFTEQEAVSFKLYKTKSGEELDLIATYDEDLENNDGLFRVQSLAGILKFSVNTNAIPSVFDAEDVIYPNPATDHVTISVPAGISGPVNVDIFNTKGIHVMHQQIISNDNTIDINNLEAGIYFVKLSTDNFASVEKLTVK